MPSWLLSLLQYFAPLVIKWALNFLESKYPGIGQELQSILDYLSNHPNSEVAVHNVKNAVATLGVSPDSGDLKKA